MLNIEQIELRQINLPLLHYFETSFGRFADRQILIIRIADVDGCEGWGECTAGESPFYSEEWTESAWAVITHFLAPMVLQAGMFDAASVNDHMRQVRGNRMAKTAIESAVWDLAAKTAGIPLWKYLGGTRTQLPSGVSIGIQNSPEMLLEKIEKEFASGYRRVKIEIKPGWDLKILQNVRSRFPSSPLMADANSAYSLKDAPLFREFDRFNLMTIEQPLAHDDMYEHSQPQKQIRTPICLDESIRSAEDARNAVEIEACRMINVKLGRIGGHSEMKRLEAVCRQRGIPLWCGGMLESGIGRAHNIAISTLSGFTLPGDVSASSRYWAEDITDPPVTVSADGFITPPKAPGIGFQVKTEWLNSLTSRREVFKR